MSGEDLLRAGYSRALWVASPEPHWLRPGGHSVCTEEEAFRELAEAEEDER